MMDDILGTSVHLEGFLQQRSAVKSLKKKWFVLRDSELKVYNNPNDAIARATCLDMVYIHDVQGVRKLASGSSSKCAIEVVSRFKKYTLVAPNHIEQDKWVKAFHNAMRNVRMRSQSSPIPGYHDRDGQYNPNPKTPPEVRKQRMSAIEGVSKGSSSQKKRLFAESWIGKKFSGRKSQSVDDESYHRDSDRERYSSDQSDQLMFSDDDRDHIYDVVPEFKTMEDENQDKKMVLSSDEDVFERDEKMMSSDDLVAEATEDVDEDKTNQATSDGYDPVAKGKSDGYDPVAKGKSDGYDPVAKGKSDGYDPVAKGKSDGYDPVAKGKSDGYDSVAKETVETVKEEKQTTSKSDDYDAVEQTTPASNDVQMHQVNLNTDGYDPVGTISSDDVKDSKDYDSVAKATGESDYDLVTPVDNVVNNVLEEQEDDVATKQDGYKVETVIPDESTAQAFEDPTYIEELHVDDGVEELRKMIRDSGLDFEDPEDDYERIEGAADETPAMAKLREMLGTM